MTAEKKRVFLRLTTYVFGLLMLPELAQAYVGPGAGLSAIGTLVALLGAILLAIVGFVWYPLKRLLRRGKKQPENIDESDQPAKNQEASTDISEKPPLS